MGASPPPLRVYLDEGRRRTFAVAFDWPGWARSGRTGEAALEALEAYLPRFAPVVRRAALEPPRLEGGIEVVERVPGTATTDFGALGDAPKADLPPLGPGEPDRLAALVAAAWATFDDVARNAPAELRKGPRGGGRDRDKIVAHVVNAEASYIRKLGLRASTTGQEVPTPVWRDDVLEALRSARGSDPLTERGWPVRYVARRIAWHVLDHAWEIEDRSGEPVSGR
jgi:hypothetical protein